MHDEDLQEKREVPDLDALLRRLDPDQYAAVTAPPGPVAVIAGAGSGKTRVLTSRIAYRIAQGTAKPANVVAFTFTRQAAAELQRRLFASGVESSVVAGTFHSVAYRILRRRWDDRGRSTLPTLATNRVEVLTELLDGNRSLAAAAATEIEWARARLVPPAEYQAAAQQSGRRTRVDAEQLARIYTNFEAHKRKRMLLDFDDLLAECIAEIQRPGVADAVAWWHRHLHVDEFQDINPLQYAFLEALRNGSGDLFVVGDPAQAIYGWNGADPGLLEQVQRGPLSPITITLPTNYRSTPQVVAAGDRVLAANRVGASHRAHRDDGSQVRTVEANDEHDEARRVVELASFLRSPSGRWSTVAVLARTHDLLRGIADAFAAAGIPTRIVTRRGADDRAASELLRTIRGARTAEELHAQAVDLVWPDDSEADPDEESVATHDGAAVRQVIEAVREFEATGGGSGRAFAAWVELQGLAPTEPGDAVELVTMHAAKGREWPAVIVAGVDTVGLNVPTSSRSPARAEEARLLYVALTRAEDRLAVTWARQRRGKKAGRSPLLPNLSDISSGMNGSDGDDTQLRVPPVPSGGRRSRTPEASPSAATLQRLRAWRSAAAKAAGVPEAFVLDDDALERIVSAAPSTVDALGEIEGVGPMVARRIAARVLPLLNGEASSPHAAP